MRLVFKSKDWYLYGFCLMRNDYRFFKLTRIKDMEIQPDVYTRELPSTYSVGKLMNIENTIAVREWLFVYMMNLQMRSQRMNKAISMFRQTYPVMMRYTVICFPLLIMWNSLNRKLSEDE